jgi:hypothetical protein
MGVHGINRLRLPAAGDPKATEDYPYWLGDIAFHSPGAGPSATSLTFRAGNVAHGMLGLGIDGWATAGFASNDSALLEYYGAAGLNMTAATRTNMLQCELGSPLVDVCMLSAVCCLMPAPMRVHVSPR